MTKKEAAPKTSALHESRRVLSRVRVRTLPSDADPSVIFSVDPDAYDPDRVFELMPVEPSDAFYRERTDRNIGWITESEQEILRRSTIGIAGAGGMGGLVAAVFLRAGVGEIRIADCEAFDVSNMNRQFASKRGTTAKSKAVETGRDLRTITDDTTIVVYPQGISEDSVSDFLDGCDIVCDEIEFWAVGARILLHKEARERGVSIFNGNTVGFGTRLFCFTPKSTTIEECLGLSYDEAVALQRAVRNKTATSEEVRRVEMSVIRGLVPDIPRYSKNADWDERENFVRRLFDEGKAPIIATNPPMATGFLADHVLLFLLRNSGVARSIVRPPEMPGYLYFDAARFETKIVTERWW